MRPILFGMTCYGDDYIRKFFDYCLPSLNTPGNLGALMKERDVRILIHTDKAGWEIFRRIGVPIIIEDMGGDKYMALGRHQHMDLAVAKEMGADYHLLMPDFVYSENCFTGMIKAIERGHKAIARLIVSTVQEEMHPHITRPRSALDLATLSLLHMHPGVKHWLATKEGYPGTHVVSWEGKHELRMCSPHASPVYIANEAIRPVNSTYPIDSLLDAVIDGDIYFPQPEDEMVIVELSPGGGREKLTQRVDETEFKRQFAWDTRGEQKQWEIFNKETVDAINRLVLESDWWNDIEISEQKAHIMAMTKPGA
jgi:hypothetical protein